MLCTIRRLRRTAPAFLICGLLFLCVVRPAGGQTEQADSTVRPDSASIPPSDSIASDTRELVSPPAPDSTSADDNPFAAFETHFLSNDVKVWYKRLSGAPNVSVSVGIPYGSDQDPVGKEELAHFTEHMLFSDHRGVPEAEIKEAIEGRGGTRNGITASDHTWYYVTIAREHGLFALEWLARLMEPHAMDPEVVDRGRDPVALEINAKPREIFDYIGAALNPSWLRLPDYWKREFGLEVRSSRSYDRWANLQGITPEDLRGFYDTYYVPSKMTVTVVGDLDLEAVLGLAEATFGTLPPRAAPTVDRTLLDPGRNRTTYAWGFGSHVRYERIFKVYEPSARDELYLMFMQDLLGRRLNQRLRYGERKAVYGIGVNRLKRGPATRFRINGSINEEEYDFAVGVIEEELEAMRAGTLPSDEFEADRRAIVERLRSTNRTANELNRLSFRAFYEPTIHRDFPDLIGFYEGVSQEELASFATSVLVPERETLSVTGVHPLGQGAFAAFWIVLVWITFRLVAWVLTTPIEMRELSYVARFRVPFPLAVARVLLWGGVGVFLFRFFVYGIEWVGTLWIEPLSNVWGQLAAIATVVSTGVMLAVLYLSRMPRKILVFPDHVRVKSLSYRSRLLRPEDVAEVSTKRFGSVWLSKGALGTSLLSLGLVKPGILLRPNQGRAYFFRSRNTNELYGVLEKWWGGRGAVETEAEPEEPPEPPKDEPPEEPLDIDSLEIDDPELEALLRANP